ncbi:alpha/beta fold hydrolase [Pseudoblastomonas halimionae]|uniref:HTH luxR-type domain-containing protein n=1 Tax=Alteriqipengyuania halimionae TaxID=1926630 RepID=A0A6I4TYJ5_9SPHN|nr:alpha/beta fold hydrolase [Alteriqipengyuania halimionae]MXP08879.1 hypothetical protein [Alteriqipengyuania halimionae]
MIEPDQSDIRRAELDLVAALYRSLGDGAAFDLLIRALQDHIEISDRTDRSIAGDEVIDRQLDAIGELIEVDPSPVTEDPIRRVVEDVGAAAIVIDDRGRQIVANTAGRALFGLANGHRFRSDLIDPTYRASFENLLRNPETLPLDEALAMRLDDAIVDPRHGHCFEIIRLRPSRTRRSVFALRMLDVPWSDDVDRTLRESFALTDAECDVARGLFERGTLTTIAEKRGTSAETVKKQVQSILAKTGAGNRIDLARLTGSIAARRGAHRGSALSAWEDPLGRQEFFVRSDGLRMAHTWMGAEHGRRVLMLHGQSIGFLLPDRAEALLKAAGLKLIIPSRPGFGESDFDPARGALEENLGVLSQFCDATGLRDVAVVGTNNGIAIALALARQKPDLVKQVIGLNYLWHRSFAAHSAPPTHQKIIFSLARNAPKLLRLFVGIAYRNLIRHGPDWYLARLLDAEEVDRDSFRDGRDLPLIRQAALHLLRQGPEAFARELQTVSHDWPKDLHDFPGDVHFLVPESGVILDRHSFAKALGPTNRVTIEAAPKSGELLLYQQATLVARTIVDRVCGPASSRMEREKILYTPQR